ncbi:uncharacterized protein LOC117500888 isoform X2 [Thalassophryne amazonica]|uniref:uncharacterized protein LOC117500888 isoform X2 n=1 Tax=Thalassophryne amazonica TaxID=390379 RepID=UPI001471C602|nr:uncharacterized protein LOC117500888 isoform X2 [Thalassophryne amazonica]
MLCFICQSLNKGNERRRKIFFLFVTVIIISLMFGVKYPVKFKLNLKPNQSECHLQISKHTITPLHNTKHLLVSAFMDQRVRGLDVRIIGIFRRDSIQPLYCHFCCTDQTSDGTPAKIFEHTDNFGFPFVTTDVMCQLPPNCKASHVSLLPDTQNKKAPYQNWLTIRNQKNVGEEDNKLQFNFTVCISSLFGGYNNVLQFTQTMEIYRLLGVDRVVIYNTSCGPDLDRLLQTYTQEGFLEVVTWPIDQHLNPSRGWLYTKHGGDLHYYGQLTTLNECVYRSMDRSRYVLLNDIDEIIMPYQHNNLMALMDMLQQQHPKAGVFLIENHIFPKKHFEPNRMFNLPQWKDVPGVNILEHIYREEPDRTIVHPYKMIVQPRAVEQTSVHSVLKWFGETLTVNPDVCRLIHVRVALRKVLTLDQLHVDKRLWDFSDRMIVNVDKVLKLDMLSPKKNLSGQVTMF